MATRSGRSTASMPAAPGGWCGSRSAIGQRPAGSPQLRRLAERLRPLLPSGRFEPLPGEPGLRNVVGTLPGRRPGIVVGAHYDTLVKPEGFVGANNGAAGTAVVVEAGARAREGQAAGRRAGDPLRPVRRRGAGRRAARGERRLLPRGPARLARLRRRRTPTGPRRWCCSTTSATRGSGYPARAARRSRSGRGCAPPRGRSARSGSSPRTSATIITDDHTPFLRAGVPAVDLIDWSYPATSLATASTSSPRRASTRSARPWWSSCSGCGRPLRRSPSAGAGPPHRTNVQSSGALRGPTSDVCLPPRDQSADAVA